MTVQSHDLSGTAFEKRTAVTRTAVTRAANMRTAVTRTSCTPTGFTLVEMLITVAVLIIVLGLMVSLARDVRNKSANQLTTSLFRQLDQALHRYMESNKGQLPVVTPLIADGAPTPDELTLHRVARRNNEDFVAALKPYFSHTKPTTRELGQSIGIYPQSSAQFPSGDFDSHHSSIGGASAENGGGIGGGATGGIGGGATGSSINRPPDDSRGKRPQDNTPDNPLFGEEFGDLPTSIFDEVTLRDAWGDPIVFMLHDHPAIGMASRASPSFFFSAGPDHRYLTRDDNLYSYEANR